MQIGACGFNASEQVLLNSASGRSGLLSAVNSQYSLWEVPRWAKWLHDVIAMRGVDKTWRR